MDTLEVKQRTAEFRKGHGMQICLRAFFLLLGLAVFVGGTRAHAASRVALIIGVDQYSKLPASAQLRVAVSDAQLLAKTLQELPDPFLVHLLTNVGREKVSKTIDAFVDEAKNAECAIVYFAGHGIEFHGENYLLLEDSEIAARPDEAVRRVKERFYYETLAMRKVLEDLDETDAKLKIVILDACRNNPIDIEGPGGTRTIVGSKGGLGRVTAPSGMLISYSADAGEEANDGLFTNILAKHLTLPGKNLMEVFAMTRSEVRKQATVLEAEGRGVLHEPAEYSKLDPSALGFMFTPGAAPAGRPSPPSVAGPSAMERKEANQFQSKKIIESKLALAELHARMDADRARYRDALNVINTLTDNKRRPVVEGSPAYHQCVAASKIITEIEKSAPELKAEEKKLETILKTLGVPEEEISPGSEGE